MLLAAGAVAIGRAARATIPEAATLLIAGPSQGTTATWAGLFLPALEQALPTGIRLGRECVGGADGVTAANQFETRNASDGGTALLLPGAAAFAWLIGDPRARFNAAQWVTALSGTTPAVLASRMPMNRITAGRVVRVAGNPAGGALPALLLLELMGALPQSISNRPDYADTDVIVVHGRDVGEQLQTASQAGFTPILALCNRDQDGQIIRDPSFPELATSAEQIHLVSRQPLTTALVGAVAAARLDTALVLPSLTSATMVALWRRACAQAAMSPAIQSGAARLGIRPETDVAAVASTAPLGNVNAAALLDLREWLAQRFGWHPR